jgi:hypothetical protein
MPPMSKRCQFCMKNFTTQRAVNQHISASSTCLKEWHKSIVRTNDNRLPKRRRTNSPEPIFHDDIPNPDLIDNLDDPDTGNGAGANVEDADNSEDHDPATPKRYVEAFPGPAGDTLRQEKTPFEVLEGIQREDGKAPWDPFASRAEWELAEWLINSVGQSSTDKYLQLPIVS